MDPGTSQEQKAVSQLRTRRHHFSQKPDSPGNTEEGGFTHVMGGAVTLTQPKIGPGISVRGCLDQVSP